MRHPLQTGQLMKPRPERSRSTGSNWPTPRHVLLSLAGVVCACAGWWWLFHLIGEETWTFGRVTFWRLIGVVAVSLLVSWLSKYGCLGRWSKLVGGIAAVASLVFLVQLGLALTTELERPQNESTLIDIGANTYVAGTWLLRGENPYASHAQVYHRVGPGPHVTRDGIQLKMYGLPYDYGYPYFPGMLLSYLPFRPMAGGLHSIRVANFVLLLASTAGIAVLAFLLAERGTGLAAGGIASAAYVTVSVLGQELFRFGVTDIAIAAWSVFAFLAAARRRYVLAGILFGVAQACKLLPGPVLVIPLLLHLGWGRPARRMLFAYAGTAAALTLPFVALDPARFVSSTVLFYLTYHSVGDNTALWFFLPEALQPWFTGLGVVLATATVALGLKWRQSSIAWPMMLTFVSYILLVAFSKMTHLNYIWGVYALGCASFGVLLAGQEGSKPACHKLKTA